MALVIKYNDDTTLTLNLPFFREFEIMAIVRHADSVKEVYADSQEHERVVQRFPGLPHGHAGTHWPGEWAKFIALNAVLLLD